MRNLRSASCGARYLECDTIARSEDHLLARSTRVVFAQSENEGNGAGVAMEKKEEKKEGSGRHAKEERGREVTGCG